MPPLLDWIPWVSPGLYLVAALWAASIPSQRWAAVAAATRAALGASLLVCAVVLPVGQGAPAGTGAAALVSLLVAFLGWVIGTYSRRYLDGEPGQTRFTIAFLATLAAVTAVAATAQLAVLVLAWAASSAALHHLLTFYRDRPAAMIVAHKKFLASRLAEGFLIVATVLLYCEWGTLDLAAIATKAQAASSLPPRVGGAAVLIAAAVLLKCAQLPLHGWLIQVMEAPTPVSALLHAGVINLGGFVLIRLAPLIGASPVAEALLVVVGSLTAAIAGLVMLTRITVKVRLAWSTCSQMGLMVAECGLGLYDLALLHLIAHALYKAYAFLTAGEAVQDVLRRRLLAATGESASRSSLLTSVLAVPVAWAIMAGSTWLWHRAVGLPMLPWIATALAACGLATLLWSLPRSLYSGIRAILATLAAAQIYVAWHWIVAEWLGVIALPPAPVLAIAALLVFVALYAVQVLVAMRHQTLSAGALYEWVYAGLYLDERFTRLAFRIWPARPAADARLATVVQDLTHVGRIA